MLSVKVGRDVTSNGWQVAHRMGHRQVVAALVPALGAVEHVPPVYAEVGPHVVVQERKPFVNRAQADQGLAKTNKRSSGSVTFVRYVHRY